MYALLRFFIGGAVDAFYRRVSIGGEIPREGPVLLVANHPNGLVDPTVVANLTPRPVRMLGKAPLFSMPVINLLMRGVGALPVYRAKDGADTAQNAATFRAVSDALKSGACVLIFPEGISHDLPSLQPLKTGAARMALQAYADGARELRVVPIGLTYRDKERFRSEVATCVGVPLSLEKYAALPEAEAMRTLTDDIASALKSVTVNLEQWEDLPLLEAVDAIWRVNDPQRTARLKVLADGVALLRASEPEAFASARSAVVEWTTRLTQLGLKPRDVAPEHTIARASLGKAVAFTLRALFWLLVGLPAALFGALWFFVPFWLVHAAYLLAKPTRDVAGTVKVIGSLLFFPTWHALAVALVAWRFGTNAAIACGTLAPVCGLTTRWFFASRARVLRDLAVMVRLGVARSLDARLDAERDALVTRFDALGTRVDALRLADR